MRLLRINLVLLALVITLASASDAWTVSERRFPDGSAEFVYFFDSNDCHQLRNRFGYNWDLAHRTVTNLLYQAGIPSSATAKFARLPAYGLGVSGTAFVLWHTALNKDNFWIRYHCNPQIVRKIDALGGAGDHLDCQCSS